MEVTNEFSREQYMEQISGNLGAAATSELFWFLWLKLISNENIRIETQNKTKTRWILKPLLVWDDEYSSHSLCWHWCFVIIEEIKRRRSSYQVSNPQNLEWWSRSANGAKRASLDWDQLDSVIWTGLWRKWVRRLMNVSITRHAERCWRNVMSGWVNGPETLWFGRLAPSSPMAGLIQKITATIYWKGVQHKWIESQGY